jgi:hypothetical protein
MRQYHANEIAYLVGKRTLFRKIIADTDLSQLQFPTFIARIPEILDVFASLLSNYPKSFGNMASTKLVELVFEDSGSTRAVTYQDASQSLVYNPHQLFELLLGGESSARFLSNLAVYGKKLAKILDQFHDCLLPESKTPLRIRKDGFSIGLVEEMLRLFTLSLLTRNLNDARSEEAIADIVLSS